MRAERRNKPAKTLVPISVGEYYRTPRTVDCLRTLQSWTLNLYRYLFTQIHIWYHGVNLNPCFTIWMRFGGYIHRELAKCQDVHCNQTLMICGRVVGAIALCPQNPWFDSGRRRGGNGVQRIRTTSFLGNAQCTPKANRMVRYRPKKHPASFVLFFVTLRTNPTSSQMLVLAT